MADNKQYVAQIQENGSVMISDVVLASIVASSVVEVEGVVGLTSKSGSDFTDKLSRKNWRKAIKIVILEDDSVIVDCNVVVLYGQSVVDIAQAAQSVVRNALESATGIKIKDVNINICGIVRQ